MMMEIVDIILDAGRFVGAVAALLAVLAGVALVLLFASLYHFIEFSFEWITEEDYRARGASFLTMVVLLLSLLGLSTCAAAEGFTAETLPPAKLYLTDPYGKEQGVLYDWYNAILDHLDDLGCVHVGVSREQHYAVPTQGVWAFKWTRCTDAADFFDPASHPDIYRRI